MTKNKKSEGFEKSLAELEEIVQKLELGETGLDESLGLFEKGIELYKKCKVSLTEVEKKIKVLTEDLKEEELDV